MPAASRKVNERDGSNMFGLNMLAFRKTRRLHTSLKPGERVMIDAELPDSSMPQRDQSLS